MASLFQVLPRAVLLSGPHAHKRPLHQSEPTTTSRDRKHIAHWDHRRAACGNCQRIFLKTQSRVAGFCSVDCHTNTAYMATVLQRTNAATQPLDAVAKEEDHTTPCAVTFGSFGLDDRMDTETCNVKPTATSAVY